MKLNQLLKSSANADKLSLTVKGILMGLVPIIILVLGVIGIKIGTEELTGLITQITAIVAGAVALYGMLRKFYFAIKGLIKK